LAAADGDALAVVVDRGRGRERALVQEDKGREREWLEMRERPREAL
jgi:hypothetical protein